MRNYMFRQQIKKHKYLSFVMIFSLFVWGCGSVPEPITFQPRLWKIGAIDYIYLEDVLIQHGLEYEFDAASERSTLIKGDQRMSFRINDSMVEVNEEPYELLFPPLFARGRILLPQELAHSHWWGGLWSEGLQRRLFKNRDRTYLRVVIDAGHGGRDRGAVVGGVEEKRITLAVAEKLKQKLERAGHQVIMTRVDDSYLSLPDRAWIANVTGADLLLSLHGNSASNVNASGVEVYYARNAYAMEAQAKGVALAKLDYKKQPNDAIRYHENLILSPSRTHVDRSVLLAETLDQGLARFPIPVKSRGVKEADFFVLNGTGAPALLIEMGFMTNKEELYHLLDPLYQDFLADWIASAVQQYNREVYY